MRKFLPALFLLFLPAFTFGQLMNYAASYRALSINFFQEEMEANFEVKEDGTISGKFLMTKQITPVELVLSGRADRNGKFKAQALRTDGAIFVVKGGLAKDYTAMPVTFTKKQTVVKKGKKTTTESQTSGRIARQNLPSYSTFTMPPMTGKTFLLIENAAFNFDKRWENITVKSFDDSSQAGKVFRILELKSESGDAKRTLRFALLREGEKDEWIAEPGKNWSSSYNETKGAEKKSYYLTEAGSVSVILDDERETGWQVKKLKLKNLRKTETVEITGYIHVPKNEAKN